MAAGLDVRRLSLVFEGRPDLVAGIQQAAGRRTRVFSMGYPRAWADKLSTDSPARVALFNNITTFVEQRLSTNSADEPAAKRRRLDGGGAPAPTNGAKVNGSVDAATEPVLLEIKDISVSIPQRKKYDLCFTQNFLYARAPGTTGPVQGIVYAWGDIGAHSYPAS